MANRPALGNYLAEFKKRANAILWRANSGKNKVLYDNWRARIQELQEMSEYTEGQAVVMASKEFDPLLPLFREYDVREHDPNPTSHANVRHFGESKSAKSSLEMGNVVIEGSELTYRENLSWAMEAAGHYARKKTHPGLCPNDTAWFLYDMATTNPKDFLMRVGQVEAKVSDSDENKATTRSSRRSIEEINTMLNELDYKPEESNPIKVNIMETIHAPNKPSEDQNCESTQAKED